MEARSNQMTEQMRQLFNQGKVLFSSENPDFSAIGNLFKHLIDEMTTLRPHTWSKNDYLFVMKSYTYFITALLELNTQENDVEAERITRFLGLFVNRATNEDHDHPACRLTAAEAILTFTRERLTWERQNELTAAEMMLHDDMLAKANGLLDRTQLYLSYWVQSGKQVTFDDFDNKWQLRLGVCYAELTNGFAVLFDHNKALSCAMLATRLLALHGGREKDYKNMARVYTSLSNAFISQPNYHSLFAAVSDFFAGGNTSLADIANHVSPLQFSLTSVNYMTMLITQTLRIMQAAVKYPELPQGKLKSQLQDDYLAGRFSDLIIPYTILERKNANSDQLEVLRDKAEEFLRAAPDNRKIESGMMPFAGLTLFSQLTQPLPDFIPPNPTSQHSENDPAP